MASPGLVYPVVEDSWFGYGPDGKDGDRTHFGAAIGSKSSKKTGFAPKTLAFKGCLFTFWITGRPSM
jgi:hypothetical protein